ncbi:MAG TPA: hypothetical protein VJN94_10210 [Candidatus Binataceae bacterium]|nr:hypothetical protein [Candidatus Binataceae bacterium]
MAVGYDLNPAMVMVAKARLLSATVNPSHNTLCENILRTADMRESDDVREEPLARWFSRKPARYLRDLDWAIQRLLVSRDRYVSIPELSSLSQISSLAAFFYVALFRVVRHLTVKFGSSNPTWMKIPEAPQRLRPSKSTIASLFRGHVAAMAAAQWADGSREVRSAKWPPVDSVTDIADSTAVPEANGSTAAAICSPPYCTRIDYAIATRIELAVLGFSDLRALRERMIGTAVIKQDVPKQSELWGNTCNKFLDRLQNHTSKASKTYYLKNHLQYFASLFESLAELDRVLCPNGQSIMVAQDSYYKEIHNDLPQVVREMGENLGWSLIDKADFVSNRHMGRVNPNTKSYRTSEAAIESVLHFRKSV